MNLLLRTLKDTLDQLRSRHRRRLPFLSAPLERRRPRIQAEDYKAGGEGVGYHDTTPGNQGATYRTDDVDIQPKASGDGYNVGWITAGE